MNSAASNIKVRSHPTFSRRKSISPLWKDLATSDEFGTMHVIRTCVSKADSKESISILPKFAGTRASFKV